MSIRSIPESYRSELFYQYKARYGRPVFKVELCFFDFWLNAYWLTGSDFIQSSRKLLVEHGECFLDELLENTEFSAGVPDDLIRKHVKSLVLSSGIS